LEEPVVKILDSTCAKNQNFCGIGFDNMSAILIKLKTKNEL